MPIPRLTFFCELETGLLQSLLAGEGGEQVIAALRELDASVSLALLDLSAERAVVVRRLNEAGVPVIAWLVLPKDQGYYCTLDNADQAVQRYEDFRRWTAGEALRWDGVGLDVEPDIRDVTGLIEDRRATLARLSRRMRERQRLKRGQFMYRSLAARIRADGYRLDVYQFPLIVDERRSGSGLLRRMLGIADIDADREVLMLYTSLFRRPSGADGAPSGLGVLGSYAPEAQSIGIGTTGPGMEQEVNRSQRAEWDNRPLSWDEFSRDLRLAYHWCSDIHIFSLEGCVREGYLDRLRSFAWDQPIFMPEGVIEQVNNWRSGLRSILWISANAGILLASLAVGFLATWQIRRLLKNRSS